MKPLLAHVRPLDVKSNTRRDCRVGSAIESEAYGLGGQTWYNAMAERAQITVELMSLDLDGRVLPAKCTFAIALSELPDTVNWKGLKWIGAPITLYSVENLGWASRKIEKQ